MDRKSGFTFIELVIVITVIALAFPTLLYYFFNVKASLDEFRLRSLAVQLAEDLMEEVASKKWDENRTQGPVVDSSKTAAASLGPEAGESRSASGATRFDDVDDYNGLSESPPLDSQGSSIGGFSEFTRTAQVSYVNSSDLDTTVASSPPPNYKRVSVTVSWSGSGNSVDVVDVFGNR
ncbi:MAG: type II secretion system protein [Chlamydiae bacterium]|nr:type II secretion system protein [Chlamydiota bacterium]MBI3266596.1 type II secretion system protein [Chlamydiota bacterium]